MATSTFDNGVQVRFTPLGHFKVTVGSGVSGLPTPPVDPERVRRVVIRIFSESVVFKDDGNNPSAGAGGEGMPILSEEILTYDGQFPENFKMTRGGDADADVRVAYYGT